MIQYLISLFSCRTWLHKELGQKAPTIHGGGEWPKQEETSKKAYTDLHGVSVDRLPNAWYT